MIDRTAPMEELALAALKAAVRKARAKSRRLGLPIATWKDGKVVLERTKPQRKKKS